MTDEKVLLERIERMSKDVAHSLERKVIATVVRLKIRWANLKSTTNVRFDAAFPDAETIKQNGNPFAAFDLERWTAGQADRGQRELSCRTSATDEYLAGAKRKRAEITGTS